MKYHTRGTGPRYGRLHPGTACLFGPVYNQPQDFRSEMQQAYQACRMFGRANFHPFSYGSPPTKEEARGFSNLRLWI